ncbi:PH domain-containing protein [Nocardia sp. NPDC052001]|uniref:PH domain-containing protein n=1 Tax=Nocardia sp. NPDC052001 TaxID=3154853 RepID=UPI0034373162
MSGTETAGAQSKSTADAEETENPAPSGGEWDLEVRPQHAIMTARIVAAVLALIFIVAGILLRRGSTGVNFRLADQLGLAVFGLLLGGAVLLLTRPRVRVGKRGVSVRNILGDNEFGWQDIRGISFADKKSWARLELVHDEYVPMMAIRTNDKLRAAGAMDRFRELGAKYTAANTN